MGEDEEANRMRTEMEERPESRDASFSAKDLRLDRLITFHYEQIERNADILKDDLETIRKRCMVPDLPKLIKENKESHRLAKWILNQFDAAVHKCMDMMFNLSVELRAQIIDPRELDIVIQRLPEEISTLNISNNDTGIVAVPPNSPAPASLEAVFEVEEKCVKVNPCEDISDKVNPSEDISDTDRERVPVSQSGSSCIHIDIQERLSGRHCEVLVPYPEPAGCGHNVFVPCDRIFLATYEDLLDACTASCNHTGLCTHKCQGTCKTCFQGRFHVRCMVQCTRILDCGHRCTALCCSQWTTSECPPCQKPCEVYCEHSSCSKKCWLPCDPCMEPCSWKCPHLKCTKLCSEPCDRSLCSEPCEKKLACGCTCIGYCGEPCPLLCRVCNKEELSSFVITGKELDELGTDPKDRFICLDGCKHTIEYTALDAIMTLDSKSDTQSEPRPKTCPHCRRGIWECRPFQKQILAVRQKILHKKTVLYGDQNAITEIQLECSLRTLPAQDGHAVQERWNFNAFRTYLRNSFVLDNKFLPTPVDDMMQIVSLVDIYLEAETRAQKLHNLMFTSGLYSIRTGYELYLLYVMRLFDCLMARQLPLLTGELQDFNRELDRVSDMFELVSACREWFPAEDSDYMEALDVLEDPCAYTKRIRIEFLDVSGVTG